MKKSIFIFLIYSFVWTACPVRQRTTPPPPLIVEPEVKAVKEAQLPEISYEEEDLLRLNKIFSDLKKRVLSLPYEKQLYLTIELLKYLGIPVRNKVAKIEATMRRINNFIGLLTQNEAKPFNAMLKFIRDNPERAGLYYNQVLALMPLFKEKILKLRLNTYLTFYKILYKNLINNSENLPNKVSGLIKNSFPDGVLYTPEYVGKNAKINDKEDLN